MADAASMNRLDHLRRFYDLLDDLADRQRGPRPLADAVAALGNESGVYFFFEPEEVRSDSGTAPRVVRVGTHALKPGASSTLRGRLRQHGGTRAGSGNHRGSIFRLLTGDALMRCGSEAVCPTWEGKPANKLLEAPLELAVSRRLALTRVVCLRIDDPPGPGSQRGWIERNSIALLSNHGKAQLDPPSADWLGQHSSRPLVRSSGLWNQRHVEERYDPAFLNDLELLIGDHR